VPPRSTPTARQRRLGAELRKLRDRAGITSVEAASQLGITQSRLSAIEGGRYGVSGERVRTFAHNYGCADAALIDALADMTVGRRRNWWEEYRDFLTSGLLDLAELEYHAESISTAQVTHLPGLLQTLDYARSIFRQNIPELPPPLLEYRTSHRIKRQQIFWEETPKPYKATIHEAALRMQFGGPDVTRAQLKHLIDMSERENITVLVIPFTAGNFPGAGQSVLYAKGPVPQLDTVQLDTEHGSEHLFADAQLDNYRTFFERFEAMALTPAPSRDFIHKIIKAL
jgi:transcriptional regulator with XRE-family HTH domain